MNLLAVIGSARKGKSTDTLVDKAIEGVTANTQNCTVKKIYLTDQAISYCRDCLTCRDSSTDAPMAECVIRDDIDFIREDVLNADLLIFGTPVHMGYATAAMMTFLERICWTFARSEGKVFTVKGCPVPRSPKKRKAVIIVTSGIVPPWLRRFCDAATPLVKQTIQDSLNAETIGDMYAGNLENRPVSRYFKKAEKLGYRLGTSF